MVNCEYGARSIWRYLVSVRMQRKRASRSRFVKNVVMLREWSVSRNGQGSREAPGPSMPGCVPFAPSRQMSVRNLAKEIEESCVVFVDAPGLPDGSYGEAREGESCVVFVDALVSASGSYGEAREGD